MKNPLKEKIFRSFKIVCVYFQTGSQRPRSFNCGFELSVLWRTKTSPFSPKRAGPVANACRTVMVRSAWTETKPFPATLTNQVGILDATFTRGGGMYISLGLLVLIILLVVLLR